MAASYGMKDYTMCGVYFNRARVLLTIVMIPLGILLYNTHRVFEMMGFDWEASNEAQQYLYFMIPGVYFFGICD